MPPESSPNKAAQILAALGGGVGIAAILGAVYTFVNHPQPAPATTSTRAENILQPLAQSCPGSGYSAGCSVDGITVKVFPIRDRASHEIGIYARVVGDKRVTLNIVARCGGNGCNQWHHWNMTPVARPDDSDHDQSFTIDQDADPDSLDWSVSEN